MVRHRTLVAHPTVLLFDIDGTLVWTGGAGRRAMEATFLAMTGAREAVSFTFAGMTDRAIVRAGLENAGRPVDEASIDRLIGTYLELLTETVRSATDYGVYPGIQQALDAVRGLASFAVGLGTGNVEPGARIKLGRVELADEFAFGGFGSDHEDRARLLAIGATRGAERLGVLREACRVIVIGDTPRDVQAALAIGAECVAVGTGGDSPESLVACGATRAFADLAAPGALEALLG
jgi:phosphoglycolate phosphatase-like HAD superfamily hydrolase